MSDPLHAVLAVVGKRIEELEQQLEWANRSIADMSNLMYQERREKEKERASKEVAQGDARRLRERLTKLEEELRGSGGQAAS